MATAQSILALRKQLIAATGESQNTEDAVIILKRLKEEVVATDELLRETKIGVTVNKLRNNTAKEVADLAKELVRKWKADVGKTGTKKTSTAAASTSNSTGASPSPGPSPIPAAKSPEPGRGPLPAITTASSAKPAASPAPESQSPAPSSSSAPNGPLRRQSSGGPPRDKTREKCCELIYDALAQDSGAPSDLILSRARALENHVWEENPPPAGSATYRNKMRSFYLNLKAANNPGLREGIVSGEISIVQLYNMDPKDMASEERKAENRKLVAENLFKAQAAAPQQAETDAFQCGKCKQRRCMYYQMQTRSADEPMTTFVTCLSCNNRWKFS
ncbi:transcription elongation factor TFIIS [Rhodotorula toruloides]